MIVLARPKMDKMSALVFHDNIIASPACDSPPSSDRLRVRPAATQQP
ncbi:Aspartate ammonia-lyase [Pantoea sp. AS-PWVM4]|nr:Aspartate ammonia-lyase [Pantoea sp. AS-PWVM4]